MKTLLSLLLVLSTTVPLFGQIQATAETRYRVSGIEGFQVVEDVVFAPEESRPSLVPIGWVTVDSQAKIIRIKAETEDRKRLEVKQFTMTDFGILGTGRIWVEVTIVDFEAQIFDQESFVIVVGDAPSPPEPGPGPGPEPEPNPSIPADKFDNLGQRIDAQADADNLQFDLRGRHAEIYESAAQKMETRQFVRTSDARAYVVEELNKISRGPEWEKTAGIIVESGLKYAPLTWEDTILWYRAVATGMRGSNE